MSGGVLSIPSIMSRNLRETSMMLILFKKETKPSSLSIM